MRHARTALVLLVISAACAPMTACSWLQRDAAVATDRTFRGPPIALEPSDRVPTIAVQAPNPGWNIELDRAEEAAGPTQLLVTIRRPDPAFFYTQQVVQKSVASRIRTSEPVEVYARILDHAEKGKDTPYERVLLGTGPE